MRSLLIFIILLFSVTGQTKAEMYSFDFVPGAPDGSFMAVTIDAQGVGSDDDSSAVSGTAVIDLENDAAPFGTAHVVELNLVLDDGFKFRLGLGGLLRATAAPGEVSALMTRPGPAVPVIEGVFSQPDNGFEMSGLVDVSILDDPFDLSSAGELVGGLNNVMIERVDNQLRTSMEVDLIFETEIENIPIVGSVPLMISIFGTAFGISELRSLPGDVDGNGMVDAGDIDAISHAISTGDMSLQYDVNGDGSVNPDDRQTWVQDIVNTFFGDANLDGEFNTADFVLVFQAGEYEDGIALNSSWATGDWTGDKEFDTADFVWAFQGGGFEAGPQPAQVPEPCFSGLLMLVAISRWTRARAHRHRHG